MTTAIKTILHRLVPKNAFARSVGVLVGGTAAAQVLMVLAAPLLTRLYTPEDFGLLAVYTGLLALIGVVSSLRYELAIPLPEDDQEAANVAALSLLIVAVTTLVSALLVLLFGQDIAHVLGVPRLAGYLWLLPVGVLLGGTYTVLNYWAVRTKCFGVIAETKLRQALATIVIQLAAFKAGALALLLGQVAGQSVGSARLARTALATRHFKQVTWRGMQRAAGRYRRFPVFSTWEGLFNTASLQMAPLAFSAFFSPFFAGLYALTHRILSLPIGLIGGAIGQVFFSNAAAARRSGEIRSLVAGLHGKLAHIGLPPALALIFVGPDLFEIVFGHAWRQAGELTQWMAPWLYLQMVSSPLSPVFAIFERQIEGMIWQALLLSLRLAALFIGVWTGSFWLTIVLFSVVSAFCYLTLLIWVGVISGIRAIDLVKTNLTALALSAILCLPLATEFVVFDGGLREKMIAVSVSFLLIVVHYWQLMRRSSR